MKSCFIRGPSRHQKWRSCNCKRGCCAGERSGCAEVRCLKNAADGDRNEIIRRAAGKGVPADHKGLGRVNGLGGGEVGNVGGVRLDEAGREIDCDLLVGGRSHHVEKVIPGRECAIQRRKIARAGEEKITFVKDGVLGEVGDG